MDSVYACKKKAILANCQDSGKVGRCMSNHTYVTSEYTGYGYMGSDGVEYATIDEAMEAGAA